MTHRPTKKDWEVLEKRAQKYYSIKVAWNVVKKIRRKFKNGDKD